MNSIASLEHGVERITQSFPALAEASSLWTLHVRVRNPLHLPGAWSP